VRRLTIRARLTVLYGGLTLAAGAILLGLTYLLFDQRLPGAIGFAVGKTAQPTASPPPGTVLAQSGPPPDADFPNQVREAALQQLLTQGGIALAVVTAVAVAFAWLMAGRALQPLQSITETARRIGAAGGGSGGGAGTGLHERIGLPGPRDEVKELADTFDTMLERLDRSFDGQRRFVANASHELRTPLAINRALIEVTVTRPDISDDARRLGEALLAVNARHERLIDGLLMLVDSENAVTELSPVDLAEVAAHVLDLAAPAATEAGVTVQPPALSAAPTLGDPVLLERLVHNLVENAVRHNAAGGWLSVSTGVADGRGVLVVTNTGPVVPRYEIESLFQPFRRMAERPGGPERGFGLGLSIVRAIARAHGGRASAEPRDGGGLVVQVTLPLSTS
jgi:signal transduction histidine kinase